MTIRPFLLPLAVAILLSGLAAQTLTIHQQRRYIGTLRSGLALRDTLIDVQHTLIEQLDTENLLLRIVASSCSHDPSILPRTPMPDQPSLFDTPLPEPPRPGTMRLATETRKAAYVQAIERERMAFDTSRNVELGPNQQTVYDVICQHADGVSNSEVADQLGWPINTVVPRTYELRKLGFVGAAEKRACRITGTTVQTWKALR